MSKICSMAARQLWNVLKGMSCPSLRLDLSHRSLISSNVIFRER
ncbi:hypothetical protein [Xylanibacter rarus]